MYDVAQLEQDSLRPGRTQTYGQLDVPQFLRDLGVRQVRAHPNSKWVSFRCPFHDDRYPSAAMHRVHTTWRCHACGLWGNAARFLSIKKGISTKQSITGSWPGATTSRFRNRRPSAAGRTAPRPGARPTSVSSRSTRSSCCSGARAPTGPRTRSWPCTGSLSGRPSAASRRPGSTSSSRRRGSGWGHANCVPFPTRSSRRVPTEPSP